MPDDTLDLGHGSHQMAQEEFHHHSEAFVVQTGLSGMGSTNSVVTQLIQTRAAQLSGDTQSMWAAALTSPTVSAAHGMRVANESGAGRTRIEANTPAGTQVVGGQ